MPERPDEQIAEDAATLRMWLQSEYYPAWERLMDDALDDAKTRVLNAPVTTQNDFYAILEAKGKYLGLCDAARLVHSRITQGEKARERLKRG